MDPSLKSDGKSSLPLDAIGANTSLREIIAVYPETVDLFTRYGLMGCGGERGPDEPLQWFAEVHNINAQTLLSEVKQTIGEAQSQGTKASTADRAPEKMLFKRFIYASLALTMGGGVLMGVVDLTLIAMKHAFPGWLDPYNEAHGHVQIFGFVSLFILGVAYHVVPRMKAAKLWSESLAETSFVLMVIGVVLRGALQPQMGGPLWITALVITSAILEAVAISLFVWVIAKTLQASPPASEGFEKYLIAGSAWFWLMGVANLGILLAMAAQRSNTIPVILNWSLRHLQLDGFIAMFIFGISRRTISVFMGRRAPDARLDRAVFYSINAAVVARIVSDLMMDVSPSLFARALMGVAGGVELLAIFGFIYNLHLFEKPQVDLSQTPIPREYEKFVLHAYAWLALATLMIAAFTAYEVVTTHAVPHAMMGAYRHALTVGFIAMMIMGYSHRIIPVFTGNRVFSPRLLNGSFAFVAVGNLMRVTFQSLTVPFGKPMFTAAGFSGYFEMIGFSLFTINLIATIQGRAEAREPKALLRESGPIGAAWSVAEVLEGYPQTLDVFLNFGFDHLRNSVMRKTLAHTVTVEQAARMKKIDPTLLVKTLNQVREAVTRASAANRR